MKSAISATKTLRFDRFPLGWFSAGFWRISAALGVIPFTLAACQTPDPGIEVRTIEVLVETPMPCPAERPDRPLPFVKPNGEGLEALAAALAAKLGEYALPGKYADKAEAYFDACGPTE